MLSVTRHYTSQSNLKLIINAKTSADTVALQFLNVALNDHLVIK